MNDADRVVEENVSLPEGVRTWQQQLIRGILRATVVVGALAVVSGSYTAYASRDILQIPFYVGAYAILVLITFWRRAPYGLQVGVFVGLIYGLSIFELIEDGLSGSGRIFLLTATVITVLFLGRRSTVPTLALSISILAAFGWAYSTDRIVVPMEILANSTEPISWVGGTIIFLMTASLMVISQNYLVPALVDALARSRRLTQELEMHRAGLEERVAERTQDLERRARYLEATAEVARDATSVLDTRELLSRVVTLISEQFDFYHTGIFLLDEAGEYAVLQSASSQGGQRMLARGHRLRVGEQGIVGYATDHGEPRIALDVGADAVHFDNPYLPETRSEMALPLRARGAIIGALDVQSTEPEAFSQEDVAVLGVLADQVAMAINNAQLFQQAQESLEGERRAYGEVSRQAWEELLRAQPNLGFLSSQSGVSPLRDQWRPEMKTALRTGQTTTDDNGATSLAMPVKVRDQVIAVVGGRKPQGEGEWTAEEITLMQTLAEQLSVALESARLYLDTQRRAAREQLTSQVTAHMRETLDVDTVLQTAAREMRAILDLAEVEVRMGVDLAPQVAEDVDQATRATNDYE